jgi:tripartite-type tricarboxylate transporter receptor subunit TctC
MARARFWPVAILLGLGASIAAMNAPADAEGYPSRPVKLVVPYPAGGPVDMIGRLLAQNLSRTLGGQFYVENVPGAGGAIGMRAVAGAAADGYTLLIANENLVLAPIVKANVGYDPRKSFTPVTLIASAPMMVVVNSSLPAKDMSQLIALLKTGPGKYNYASPGYGSSPHLASEWLFNLTYRLNVVHVPFQGAAPAVQAVLSGEPPIFHEVLPAVMSHIRSGAMRALAVASSKRSGFFPNVPTLAEIGAPGHEVAFWSGILLPAGTPEDIVAAVHHGIAEAMKQREVKERLATLGFDPMETTPEGFAAYIAGETDRWRKVVREANIKIE